MRSTLSLAAFLLVLLGSGPLAHAADQASPAEVTNCGPIRPDNDFGGFLDYRLRDIDKRVHDGMVQVDRYHTVPARHALSVTPTNESIIADLDFTLRHSPNHIEALGLLIQYKHSGGQDYGYPALECFLTWARQYAPDDADVLQLTAYYYWKAGQPSYAEEFYEQALKLDSSSAELHYNVGLFYFSQKNYAKAREHARIAYAGGFPLPGLRKMLERVHQWTDASPAGAFAGKH